ncbi:hypothetical protein OV208_30120 [Corallococcus sp. bb12-1]|uniref:hypothetical protein n=1 Tax=Corallococcus sp. bb12-1 TaxID=2996784 RepID=UPI00226E061F|nr:hypothetical protein [Corallococcus sp. bb12-1]MCY1045610.1 hypothetical protein [Corallococcus sp. bb12-1]
METKDYISIAIPIASFLLGILSGGIIIPRLTAKRKILAWAVVSENEIIPKEMAQSLGIPVTIMVGQENPTSLTTVNVKLGNNGNDIIENTTIAITSNTESKILNTRIRTSGEFEKRTKTAHNENVCSVTFEFLNPEHSVDVELLISNYSPGSTTVDAAAPGVILRRQEVTHWNLSTPFFISLAFPLLGLKYNPEGNPGSLALQDIVKELRSLRDLATTYTKTTKGPGPITTKQVLDSLPTSPETSEPQK